MTYADGGDSVMARLPRAEVIDETEVGVFHCVQGKGDIHYLVGALFPPVSMG